MRNDRPRMSCMIPSYLVDHMYRFTQRRTVTVTEHSTSVYGANDHAFVARIAGFGHTSVDYPLPVPFSVLRPLSPRLIRPRHRHGAPSKSFVSPIWHA
jgi:hypothetical protein